MAVEGRGRGESRRLAARAVETPTRASPSGTFAFHHSSTLARTPHSCSQNAQRRHFQLVFLAVCHCCFLSSFSFTAEPNRVLEKQKLVQVRSIRPTLCVSPLDVLNVFVGTSRGSTLPSTTAYPARSFTSVSAPSYAGSPSSFLDGALLSVVLRSLHGRDCQHGLRRVPAHQGGFLGLFSSLVNPDVNLALPPIAGQAVVGLDVSVYGSSGHVAVYLTLQFQCYRRGELDVCLMRAVRKAWLRCAVQT